MMGREAAADGKGKRTEKKVTAIGRGKREEKQWKEGKTDSKYSHQKKKKKRKNKPGKGSTVYRKLQIQECEFIIKKVIRSYGNNPYTLAAGCVQFMAYSCLSLPKF